MRYGVIMAGGSGTRFWPLSRKARPKQLLPLWHGRTLLELTVERLRPLIPEEQVLVVTGRHLAEAVAQVLPDLPDENVVVEPSARNTLPCVALAVAEIGRRCPDATMGIFSADHFIDDRSAFLEACRLGFEAAGQGRIATIGVRPTRPETGFGYIRYVPGKKKVLDVDAFVEKPDRVTAERYLAAGNYLWNAGIFFCSLDKFRSEVTRQRPEFGRRLVEVEDALAAADREALAASFNRLEATSVDYGIMEGAREVVVMPAGFAWNDVGHWGALEAVLNTDAAGNVALGDVLMLDTSDSVAINQGGPGTALALVGVEGLVVVRTPDATLVLPKGEAQRVREVVSALRDRGRGDLL